MSQPNWRLVADLALELVASAYGRGQSEAGPDDPRISSEARAIEAMRAGDHAKMERCYRTLRKRHEAEWAELERLYGPKP